MALLLNCKHISFLFGQSLFTIQSRNVINTLPTLMKKNLDFSNVPVLEESDLEETFVRGNGPGGQAVAKTSNCVVLQHKPTGLIIKCHQTRSVDQNRKIARELLITKLDNMLNNEHSIKAQMKVIFENKLKKREQKRKKLQDMKNKWKASEGIT